MANRIRKRVFTNKMRFKLIVVFGFILLGFGFVGFRLMKFNVKDGKRYEKQVLSQQNYRSTTIPYARGEITDRNGTPLATSVKVYNLIIEPKNIIDADEQRNKGLAKGLEKNVYQKSTVSALAQFFGLKEDELNKIIEENPKSYYQKLLKRIEYDKVKPFQEFLEQE